MDRPSTPVKTPMQELLEGSIPSPTAPRTIRERHNNGRGFSMAVARPEGLTSSSGYPIGSNIASYRSTENEIPQASSRPLGGSFIRPQYSQNANPDLYDLTLYNRYIPTTTVPLTSQSFAGQSSGQADVNSQQMNLYTPYASTSALVSHQNPHTVSSPRRFMPTTMAFYGRGIQPELTAGQRLMRAVTGMSPNYRGNPANIRNYGVPGLPDNQNTSFWIRGLPATISYREFLSQIRRCGPVWATNIVNKEALQHGDDAAAELVFFKSAGANRFARQYMDNQSLGYRGQRAIICHNRDAIPEDPCERYLSRCIRIIGPSLLVNPVTIETRFKGLFEYKLDQIVVHHYDGERTDLEIHFGSYRAQASMAYKFLTTNHMFADCPDLLVSFVRDPCDI